MCNVQLLEFDAYPALIARVVPSIIFLFLSLSLARARSLEVYYRYVRQKFLNFHLFASIYRIARDFYVNALYRRRRHFVFIIGSFYFEGPREQMCVLLGFL